MQSAISAQERPARNALTVGVRCVNRTLKHAASVTAYSVLRACPSIQCSTRSLHQQTTRKFGNGKEHKIRTAFRRSGFFPISQSHKLIQNFLQSFKPPFVVGGCPSISPVHILRFASLISAISSRSFLMRSDTNFGINSLMNRVFFVSQ